MKRTLSAIAFAPSTSVAIDRLNVLFVFADDQSG